MAQSSLQRVVLITGGALRIGRAIALALARDGWHVAIHVRRSRDAGHALADEVKSIAGRAAVLVADLANQSELETLLPQCIDRLGVPCCLINNASEFQFDSLQSMSHATWATHFDVNLKAPIFLARAFAASLPEAQQGHVVNIIDQRVLRPTPEFFSYSLSKAALWDATRMLAQALAPRVRVNAIGPGPILASVHQSPEEFEAERTSTLLGRGSSPEEIAAAVRFILDAPAMTGQMIALDGGQHLGWSGFHGANSTHGVVGR